MQISNSITAGNKGSKHHSWSGGIKSLIQIDDIAVLPDENKEQMKLWLARNSIKNETTGCWEWIKRLDKHGYAPVNLKRTTSYAHRLSYVLYRGLVGHFYVLHDCDNPKCVNPDHLSLGTQLKNMQDAVKRGRLKNRPVRYGSKSPGYKHGKYCK